METSDEVIKYYNPAGLGGAKYFIFEGIKVFPLGLRDEIKGAEEEQMGRRLHGSKEGKVL